MGAIFGCIDDTAADNDVLARLSSALQHRGKAEARGGRDSFKLGVRYDAAAAATAAAHGLESESGPKVAVVLEGRVVNARELWSKLGGLEGDGSQALLIARLYESYGVDLFRKLRGAFAIAIWDDRERQLTIARDPVGQKNVFYSQTSTGFFFASETKALLAAGVVPFEVDRGGLSHFLSLRFVPSPYTLVRGVEKVPPAHYVVYRAGRITRHRYWSLSFGHKFSMREAELIDALETKIKETVAAYVDDGTGVGAFLSAGLDSGLLVAYMSGLIGRSFPTFSLGVKDQSDEIPGARLVAKKYGTEHHEFYPETDFVRLLPKIVWALDEASDTVAVSKFLLAVMAAPHVRAAVSGDGGDELFAGFPRYLGVRDSGHFVGIPGFLRNGLIVPVARALGGLRDHRSLCGKIHWMAQISGAKTLGERYANAVTYLRFGHRAKQALFAPDVWRDMSDVDSEGLIARKVVESDAEDPVEKLVQADIQTRLPEHLLMMDDRTGSSRGLEILCPLADRDLMEFCAKIPVGMKVNGRKAKYIERKVADRVLPPEVAALRKTGFSFPFGDLCATSLQPFLKGVVEGSRLIEIGLLRPEPLRAMIADQGSRRADHHVRLWLFLNLEIWFRLMEGGSGPDALTLWMDRHLHDSAVT